MLTYKDCLDWSELDQEDVDAISEHTHMSQILALAFGQRLSLQHNGPRSIRKMMINDIRQARQQNNLFQAAELKQVLQQYIKTHPV